MFKSGERKLISLALVILLTLIALLMDAGQTAHAERMNALIRSSASVPQLQSSYSLPDWWRPCLQYVNNDKTQPCTKWDMTENPVQCDGYNYQQKTGSTPTLLTSWRGIHVCGPGSLVGVNFSYPATSIENEFQCTELVKRYLLLAYGLPSLGGTDGNQVVDNYTAAYPILHKVVNNGAVHMAPVEGDVLSYSPIHTSIVIGANVGSDGSGTITVAQENISWNKAPVPIEPLKVINWVVQASTHGAGSVISWMTTRASYFWVTAEQDYSTQGAGGNFSQHQPSVTSSDPGEHSAAEVALFDGTFSTWTQSVEMGWMVRPSDTQPHLFVFTWYDNGNKMCYVSRTTPCDFHSLSGARYYPGDPVTITNTPQTYEILHYQGNWFIGYINQWIGYIPDSHWNNTFTQVKSVQWLGEIASLHTSPCTDMGNGTKGSVNGSAVINSMFFIDGNGGPYPAAKAHLIPHPYTNLYDAGHFSPNANSFNSFTYGGPGAC